VRIEVETRTVDGQTTALGSAGPFTLVVDRPVEAGGGGRGFGGEELLYLALAGSLSNALFRAADAEQFELTRVRVRVRGELGSAEPIEYDLEVEGDARADTLRALAARADESAEVLQVLRRGTPVRVGRVAARSDFPVRTLDECLAVCRFMAGWPGPWWVGGGWAIDLWAGGASREHEDVEICVPREDQLFLRDFVPDWRSYTPKNNQWAPLADGELLEPPAFMWQLRRTADTEVTVEGMPPRWEFLLNEVHDGEWTFPRDPTVRLSLDRLVLPSTLGPPVMAPEAVLLHKAFHNPPRPKDDHDFLWANDRLTPPQRAWLRTHLARLLPDHPWLPKLAP
jgi:putative redox protein